MGGDFAQSESTVVNVFRALADTTRWEIVVRMAECQELACTTLEAALPLSKSTISYHIKALHQAGLIDIRREGKFYFYRLRSGVLHDTLERARMVTDCAGAAV